MIKEITITLPVDQASTLINLSLEGLGALQIKAQLAVNALNAAIQEANKSEPQPGIPEPQPETPV